MKKALLLIFTILLISIVACQKAQTGATQSPTTEKAVATGDAAVDAVGNDLNTADSVEKDLDVSELNDIDSGLSDLENI